MDGLPAKLLSGSFSIEGAGSCKLVELHAKGYWLVTIQWEQIWLQLHAELTGRCDCTAGFVLSHFLSWPHLAMVENDIKLDDGFTVQEKNRFTKEGMMVITSTKHRTQRCGLGLLSGTPSVQLELSL
jgi:hypothetical protein